MSDVSREQRSEPAICARLVSQNAALETRRRTGDHWFHSSNMTADRLTGVPSESCTEVAQDLSAVGATGRIRRTGRTGYLDKSPGRRTGLHSTDVYVKS